MEKDRIRWNEKYRVKTNSGAPSDIVTRFYSLGKPGRALDIAAGMGKNALFLAEKGFEVDAVDISDVAMDALADRHLRVHARCRDLDTYDIPGGRYDLILNIRYLNRRLFPYIIEGLKPGGLLVFETFIEKPGENGVSMHRDFLLRENELLHAFLALQVLHYEEKNVSGSKGPEQVASLVARNRG
jgi:tellurite methyltransferase